MVGKVFYGMHAHWFSPESYASGDSIGPYQKPKEAPPAWATQVASIGLYDSLAFITRGEPLKKLQRVRRGVDAIPYGKEAFESLKDNVPLASSD